MRFDKLLLRAFGPFTDRTLDFAAAAPAGLHLIYGPNEAGKSSSLLQAAYNYEERGQHVLLAKPAIDTKESDRISSRLGMSRPVDFLIHPDAGLRELFA